MPRRRHLLVPALACCLGLAAAPAALAHSQLISSDPADGAVLAQMPTRVTLTFNEDIDPKFSQAVVADGSNVVRKVTPSVSGPTLTVPMPEGEPRGRVEVRYRVVSADSHLVAGKVSFTAGAPATSASPSTAPSTAGPTGATTTAPTGAAAPSTQPTAARPADSEESPSTTWMYVLSGLAALVVVGAGLAILVMSRRSR